MLTIHQENVDEKSVVLRLEGAATVETADQLREALLNNLRDQEHLLVDSSQLEQIDFYTLQMLCSAHRTSVAWGKCLTFSGAPGSLVDAASRAGGFARINGCTLCPADVRCMWSTNSFAESVVEGG